MRIAPLPLIIAVLALGGSAAPAAASTADAIIKDCSNSQTGLLTGSYSKSELRDARKLVRGDIAEYTGCMDAINAALNRSDGSGSNGSGGNSGSGGSGGGTGGGGSGTDGSSGLGGTGTGGGTGSDGSFGSTAGSDSTGSTPGTGGTTSGDGTTPATPVTPTPAPVQQAGSGAPVTLGGETVTPGIPASYESDRRSLPTPLVAFLVLLAAAAIGFGAPTIGRRVLARRRA
jgi:hypothetical protein